MSWYCKVTGHGVKEPYFECKHCVAKVSEKQLDKGCPKCGNGASAPTSKTDFLATGYNGVVELLSDKIVIKRNTGIFTTLSHGLKGDKSIPIRSITAVQFKKPGWTSGYIQFTILGGVESKAGLWDAAKDENTVCFRQNAEKEFTQLKELVEERMQELQTNGRNVGAKPGADELETLHALMKKGIISKAEFETKKKQILGL